MEPPRRWPATLLLPLLVVHLPPQRALADVYLNNPRGSNNKLNEQNNNRQNANRLFDSQNNNNGGYQVGDKCNAWCGAPNNFNANDAGAGEGIMYYHEESELYIEWHLQHGCGVDQPNVMCQNILQYMCDTDNPFIRDGSSTNTPPIDANVMNVANLRALHGYHESVEYYQNCSARERNRGLYIADQQVGNNAINTRQNPGGTRRGLECPEERDYYPYWHPTPWHDIAIITDEPERRCKYYQRESQNVAPKGLCSLPQFNNDRACVSGGGRWIMQEPFGEPPPDCLGGVMSRDNHNGNARNAQPMYYLWKIPSHILQNREEVTCTLRLRYNMSSNDFDAQSTANIKHARWQDRSKDLGHDYFFVDQSMNQMQGQPNANANRRRQMQGGRVVLPQNPRADFVDLGQNYQLNLQINTNQYGRTFEDRTHIFRVRRRPRDVPMGARIVNYNVRGRRGNIVQVYPSVEYDFVPTELTVKKGDYLHFQWTGSDANNAGNDGNGRQQTDRSNLVQTAERGDNVPIDISRHTLLFNGRSRNQRGVDLVRRFAYLDQNADSPQACDVDTNDQNGITNCKQLNRSPNGAYFDGGLVRMEQIGTHHVLSTRNNDFSNRSQKATIVVTRRGLEWWEWLLISIASVILVGGIAYLSVALYAYRTPSSWLFSKRYRPRILQLMLRQETLSRKEEERKELIKEEREALKRAAEYELQAVGAPNRNAAGAVLKPGGGPGDTSEEANVERRTRTQRCCQRADRIRNGHGVKVYMLVNVVVFIIGFATHWGLGFQAHWAFPLAKGAGYMLDLNFAMLVLPTLKSLQTALRGADGSTDIVPNDPIAFHITVAKLVALGSVVHIAAHLVHMMKIAEAPPMQHDVLEQLALSEAEKVSGTPLLDQFFDTRGCRTSGVVITVIMLGIYLTAQNCVRRGGNRCMRLLGGYKLFARLHSLWVLLYLLLLIHAPARLWIWFFFPALFVMMDRLMLTQHQRPFARLIQARLLEFDVLHLTFELPEGFSYQAGQYVMIGWRKEWHPFTLTSAPEERLLSVHIRAPDVYDWCSALRRRLIEEAPMAAGVPHAEPKAKAGTVISYNKCYDLRSKAVYSRPVGGPAAGARATTKGNKTAPAGGAPVAVVDVMPDEEGVSFSNATEEELPDDAVVLQLSGPFGAPAQRVWEFDTILVVGSGIGVTPFVSILRSVQLRAQQRNAMLGRAANAGGALKRRPDGAEVRQRGAKDFSTPSGAAPQAAATIAAKSQEELIDDIIPCPTRVHFVWIVRDQREVNWFYGLLCSAVEGPAKDIIEIDMYMTGEVEISKVKKIECAHNQFFGRPNWARVFKTLKEQHPQGHVGVFLCGSPEIGAQLAEQSAAFSDAPGTKNGMKFSFFKENF